MTTRTKILLELIKLSKVIGDQSEIDKWKRELDKDLTK